MKGEAKEEKWRKIRGRERKRERDVKRMKRERVTGMKNKLMHMERYTLLPLLIFQYMTTIFLISFDSDNRYYMRSCAVVRARNKMKTVPAKSSDNAQTLQALPYPKNIRTSIFR